MAQIIVKNGLEKDLSKAMSKGTVGEPIFTTDTEKFFVTNGSKVVEIGATDPDVMEHIKNLQDTKVDKVSGKGLSTNDFTTAEKNKLAGITTGANNYVHPSEHPASMIKFTDGKTFQQKIDDGSLRGPKGDTGAKGATGAQGPQGIQGPTGAKGATGTSMRFKGAWSSTTAYVCDANYVDIVTSGGNTYRCKANNTNQAVTNTTYWEVLAQKGATGTTGPAGPQGIQGPAGPNTLTTSTTTSGFTNGHFIYNNNGKVGAKALPTASTSAAGIVQLSSATNSTSTTLAATASAVKAAYDLAAGKANASHSHSYLPLSGGTLTGNLTISSILNASAIQVSNKQMIAAERNTVYLGNQTVAVTIQANANPRVQVGTGAFHTLYHTGNKPTPAEIGAINKSDGTGLGYSDARTLPVNRLRPKDYQSTDKRNGLCLELNNGTILGLPGSGLHHIITSLPWNDTTNGARQIALDAFGDDVYVRRNDGISLWTKWVRLATERDINDLKQSVSSGKNAIASAITAKGVAVSGSDSHATLANKISQIKQTPSHHPSGDHHGGDGMAGLYHYVDGTYNTNASIIKIIKGNSDSGSYTPSGTIYVDKSPSGWSAYNSGSNISLPGSNRTDYIFNPNKYNIRFTGTFSIYLCVQ